MSTMDYFYVYCHITADAGKIFYVGKGKGRRVMDYGNRSDFWKNVANKHGVLSIVLRDGLTEKEAFDLEKHYVKKLGRRNLNTGFLVNMTDGGDGGSGYTFSEETKKKMSERVTGDSNPFFGKKHSEERKAAWKIARKNHFPTFCVPHTPEVRDKIKQTWLRRDLDGIPRPNKGRVWMNNTEGSKLVPRDEVSRHIEMGFIRGRSNTNTE